MPAGQSSSSRFTPLGEDHSPSPSPSQPGPRSIRRKTGCLTCRLRKKRCDEGKPVCQICVRLGLNCMGYEPKRPRWMNEGGAARSINEQISRTIHDSKLRHMRDLWSDRAAKRLRLTSSEPNTAVMETPVLSEDTPFPLDRQENILSSDALTTASNEPKSSPEQLEVIRSSQMNLFQPDAEILAFTPDTSSAMTTSFNRPYTPLHLQDTPYQNQHNFEVIPGGLSDSPFQIESQFDRELLSLLGLSAPIANDFSPFVPSPIPFNIEALSMPLPSPFPTIFPPPVTPVPESGSPESSTNMVYFHHYLNVILPLQYKFDNQSISDLVAPLAFRHPEVFRSLSALAALHMASRRRLHQPPLTRALDNDPDFSFAQTSIHMTISHLQSISCDSLGSEEAILAAMTTSSFYLYMGGNVKGWKETADLIRRCLAALSRKASGGSNGWDSHLDLSSLTNRLGHLINPIVWTDILVSVTEGKATEFLPMYRKFLLNDQVDVKTSRLLRETVMGCDSTTRLSMAETIALSEWKENCLKMGRLSYKDLVERAASIELLLSERKWRERHLFEGTDPVTKQRKAMSDVFYHGVKVLLATVVNGCFPNVPEVSSAVNDTARALSSLDALNPSPSPDRLLVMPITLAGCHADTPLLQQAFRERFLRLGEDAAAFGNTSSALALMEEVWKRRSATKETPDGSAQEVEWRKVMYQIGEDGVLLI